MTDERIPGIGPNIHKDRRVKVSQDRMKIQEQIRFKIREAEIRRVRQHIDNIVDPNDFASYPPDGEIQLGRAALSRLYHQSTQAKDYDLASFAEQGLQVLKQRWEKVGHAATCNTGRMIVPAKSSQPWVPSTRG